MRVPLIVSLFLLSGCASQQIDSFTPYTPEINIPKAYQADLLTCRKYAQEYLSQNESLDALQMAQAGSTGAISNAPDSYFSPWIPAIGAVSGASSEALNELGITAQAAKKVLAWCMHDKGLKDGFGTYDPNL